MRKTKEDRSNKFDILCSIWILACNDENPQITYQGIVQRLGLHDNFDIKHLVHSRGELFRKQTTQKQLNDWKAQMIQNKHIPTWIRDINNVEKRKQKIESLQINDVFRSQFRPEANSPKSDIEIINWGLQHIDRLRKAELEIKQERTRFFTSVIIPIFSSIIAIIAIISSFYIQIINNENQAYLKHYEVELKPKQEGYTNFMNAISKSYFAAATSNGLETKKYLEQTENAFYIIEPFLSQYDRNRIWNEFQNYTSLCYSILEYEKLRKNEKKTHDSYSYFREFFRQNLFEALFSSNGSLKK